MKKRYRAYYTPHLNSWFWFKVFPDGTLRPCAGVVSSILERIKK